MIRQLLASIGIQQSDELECLKAFPFAQLIKTLGPANGRIILWFKFGAEHLDAFESAARTWSEYYADGKKLLYREECIFAKDEIANAELLAVRVDRRPIAIVGVEGGMCYDFTINPSRDKPAPWCWQQTPLILQRRDVPKPEIGLHQTIPMETIVHRRLLDLVHGLNAGHVRLGRIDCSVDWFQLMSDRTMPPYHNATTGTLVYRQECAPPGSPPTIVSTMTEGYWPAYLRSEVLDAFSEIPPIAFTHELEGYWSPEGVDHLNAVPQPRLLVSQKTRLELINAGVKRLEYTPIRWMD